MKTKVRPNPALYATQLRAVLGDDPERLQRTLTVPCSLDLLTWNLFAGLETHADPDWLAHRLQVLGGPALRAPLRVSLWTGRDREPLLRSSRAAVAHVRARMVAAGTDEGGVAAFAAPFEVPVRIESPDVLVLVDTMDDSPALGVGGRDRIVELVDAGLEQARRLGVELAVAVVYRSGSRGAAEVSARLDAMRAPGGLARAMPWHNGSPAVTLREVSWQQLVRIWEAELDYLDVPVPGVARSFLGHLEACGLR